MKLEPIDLTNLDTILQTHAYEFQEATESLPTLRNQMSAAKLEIDRIEASLYLSIRRAFEGSGEKFTEAKITSSIKSHSDYIAACSNHLNCREAYDKVDQVREVFMQRESSIKNLVSLYHAQYWSLGSINTVPKAKADGESGEKRFKERA
jgi:hypothetical protein